MPAAEPDHRHGRAGVLQGLVVGDRLVEREQRVDRALQEERGRGDLADRIAGAPVGEPVDVRGGDVTGRVALLVRLGDVRVDLAALRERGEEVGPALLVGVALVEAGGERVPGDRRDDGVDAAVGRRRAELDAAAVGATDHAGAWVARGVELDLRAGGEPVEHPLDVPDLVGTVDGDRSGRLAEPARVPGEDVVARGAEAVDARAAEERRRCRLVLGAGLTPARALEDGRCRLRLRRTRGGVPVQSDLAVVERGHGEVVGLVRDRFDRWRRPRRRARRSAPGSTCRPAPSPRWSTSSTSPWWRSWCRPSRCRTPSTPTRAGRRWRPPRTTRHGVDVDVLSAPSIGPSSVPFGRACDAGRLRRWAGAARGVGPQRRKSRDRSSALPVARQPRTSRRRRPAGPRRVRAPARTVPP